MSKPRLFIASSTENLNIAYAAQANLEADAEVIVWDQGIFGLSSYNLEALSQELDRADFDLFIFAPEDTVRIRDEDRRTVRDNVVFELGLFVGHLSRERCFVLRPRGIQEQRIPTDLSGLNVAEYDPNRRDQNLRAALGSACYQIRNRIRPQERADATEKRMDWSTYYSAIVKLLQRKEVGRAVGTVKERLAKATNEVWISGNDNMYVARSVSASVERALERGVAIRMLCVDPESPAADMLPLIDPRFKTKDFFVSEVRTVESVLQGWRNTYARFQFRFLPILPAVGYFITDPGTSHETVKAEIYTAKPWEPIDTRPHLVIGAEMPEWCQYFVAQFENYWKLSREP